MVWRHRSRAQVRNLLPVRQRASVQLVRAPVALCRRSATSANQQNLSRRRTGNSAAAAGSSRFASSLMWTAPGVARLVSLVAVISCASTGCPVAPLVVFFCLVKSRRFRPEIAQASRAAVVKHGRRPPRSVLDPGEHGANVGQAGGIVMPPDQRWRKIRSVAPLCPACNAAFAAGHHGCARTCQAPICLA